MAASLLAYQRLPSGPVVMLELPNPVGTANSVIAPEVVIRPIRNTSASVNQSAPSGPVVIAKASLLTVRTGNTVITPAVVIRPMLPPAELNARVNQRLPSGPAVMLMGEASPVVIGNSANFVFVFFAHTPSDCRQSATSMQPTRT